MIEFIQYLYTLLGAYPELFSFFAPVVAGEIGVIFASFVASSGAFPISIAIFFGWLSLLVMDLFWFSFPKTALYRRAVHHRLVKKQYQKMLTRLETMTGGKDFLILLVSKMLIGTRILVIVFIGARTISYGRFFVLATLVNALWVLVLVTIGFVARSGFDRAVETFQNIQIAVALLLLFGVLLYYAVKLLQHRVFKNGNEK